MKAQRSIHARAVLTALAVVLLVLPDLVRAASRTLIPSDRNLGVAILDAKRTDNGARVLYFTYPEVGQAHLAERCALNVYWADLSRGLASIEPQLLAENYCSNRISLYGALLDSGEIMLVAARRVEIRDPAGRRVSEWTLDADTTEHTVHVAASSDGRLVLAETFARAPGTGVRAQGLAADGTMLWRAAIEPPGVLMMLEGAWAAPGGGALVHLALGDSAGGSLPDVQAPTGTLVTQENRLYVIDPQGVVRQSLVLTRDQQPNLEALLQAPNAGPDPARLQGLLQQAVLERVLKLAVVPSATGGFDVLLERRSHNDAREGHFLYSIAASGEVLRETRLTERLAVDGLEDWTDFAVRGEELVLYGTVLVSKPGTVRRAVVQPSISRLSLGGESVVTHLLPLDERSLTAFLSAGDEQIQHLENLPAGIPARLAELGATPLGIAINKRAGRAALVFDEATNELAVYTEARDAARARAAVQAQREQRATARVAQRAEVEAALARAAGLTPEEFAALDQRERDETLIRQGDLDAVMAIANEQITEQMRLMQEALANASGQGGADSTALATTLQQLQTLQAGALAAGAMPPESGTAARSPEPAGSDARVVELDANLRGWVEYDDPGQQPVTLTVRDAESERALVSRRYLDGQVYENIDFGRLGVPLERIRIVLTDDEGRELDRLSARRR